MSSARRFSLKNRSIADVTTNKESKSSNVHKFTSLPSSYCCGLKVYRREVCRALLRKVPTVVLRKALLLASYRNFCRMLMRSAGAALRVGRIAERTRLHRRGLLSAVARALVGPAPAPACGSLGLCSGLAGSAVQLAGCLTPARAYSSFGFGSPSADSLRHLETAANNPANARNIEAQRQYIEALSE